MTTQSQPGWNASAPNQRGRRAPRALWLLVALCASLTLLPPTAQAANAGDFDPSFATGGQLRLQLGRDPTVPGSWANDVALQPDGKLVLGGAAGDPDAQDANEFMIARLHPNGTLDTTFGTDGSVQLQLADALAISHTVQNGRDLSSVYAVAIQPDGKIIAAGSAVVGETPPADDHQEFALARFNPDGTLDPNFGSNGIVHVQPNQPGAEIHDIDLQPDGKIVAAGLAQDDTTNDNIIDLAFAAVRLNPDGTLDPSFGNAGKIVTQLGTGLLPSRPDSRAHSMVIQPDGRIVLAGSATDMLGNDEFALARFNPDGTADTSFSDDGRIRIQVSDPGLSPGSYVSSLALQGDGKLIAAGAARDSDSDARDPWQVALARFSADGALDTSFGSQGKALVQMADPEDSPFSGLNDIALQPDGKIVGAGLAGPSPQDDFPAYGFLVARFNVNGSIDNSFGTAGKVTAQMGEQDPVMGRFSTASALALQPDKKIVAAGFGTYPGPSNQIGVVRVFGRPGPVASFDFAPAAPRTGEAVTFSSTSSVAGGSIVRTEWDFGEGFHDGPAQISHTFTSSGSHDVFLRVTGSDGQTATVTRQVAVANRAPLAAFGFAPSAPKTGESVAFDGSGSSDPDGSLVGYAWEFGDGASGSGAGPSHVYAQAGSYTVKLTVTDDDGATASVSRTVAVANRAPSAAFGFAPGDPGTGEAVSFDGSGSSDPDGSVVAYAWEFGDGGSASGAGPSHAYAQGGSYTVTLTVTDDDGSTGSVSRTVAVANRAPSAAFGFVPSAPSTGESVAFDGSGSSDPDGSVVAYAWDFGDGASGSGAGPLHAYAAAGSYTVTLTVTDDDGAMASVSRTVTVAARPVSAAFSFSPSSPSTGQAVSFDGSGSTVAGGSVSGYSWSFGDGASATGATPSHTYAKAGSYTVTLTATGADGATDSVSHTVTVANRLPVASIAAAPSSPLTGEPVSFDASGSSDPDGSIIAFEWDLDGDGSYETDTGTDPRAARSYGRSGPVTVRVRVRDDDGASTTSSRVVNVTDRPPVAALSAAPNPALVGEAVTFDASASSDPDGTITRYEWDLDGDGSYETDTATAATASRSYSAPGAVVVGVRVSDDRGGISQTTVPVQIDPRPIDGSGTGPPAGGASDPGATDVRPAPGSVRAGDSITQVLPPPPFVGSLGLPRGQTLRAVLRRGVGIVVHCSMACRARVAVTLDAKVARALGGGRSSRSLVIARATRQLKGGPAVLSARLSAAAKRLLRKARRLTASVRVRLTANDGTALTLKRKLVLRR
jgi:uncharacterized delta-60 repeat protein